MLVRWCPDVASLSCASIFMMVLGADVVSFGAQGVIWHAICVHFAPWGSIERSKGTWEHENGDLGFLSVLGGLRDQKFSTNFEATYVSFVHRCCQFTFLNDFGV